MKALKIVKKTPSAPSHDLSGIEGNHKVLQRILNTKPKAPHPRPLKEVRERLFGGVKYAGKTSEGIRGYNKTMLSRGMPQHCCTVYRLCELLLEWGLDPLPWLKGEAQGIGYVPGAAVGLPD